MDRKSLGREGGSAANVSKSTSTAGVRRGKGHMKTVSRSKADGGSFQPTSKKHFGGEPQQKPSGNPRTFTKTPGTTGKVGSKRKAPTKTVKSNAQVKASQNQRQTNFRKDDNMNAQTPRGDTPRIAQSKAAFLKMQKRGSY